MAALAEPETRHDEPWPRIGPLLVATRQSPATLRTTGRRSAPCRSTASPPSACRSSRSCPRCGTSQTRTAITVRPRRRKRSSTSFLLDELERTILAMGAETVCLVHMEPVQNAGGAFVAPRGLLAGRARAVHEVRHPALRRRGDHGLRARRLLVRLERYDIQPDIVCCAKGLSSSYAAIGAVVTTDRVMEPFLSETPRCSRTASPSADTR